MIEGFSIIVCTHNPDFKVFNKLLISLSNLLNTTDLLFEILFVDNNSKTPLSSSHFFMNWVKRENTDNIKVIQEFKPGLTWARIKGIEEAKYNWLVFFDDDNEPAEDYLVQLSKVIKLYPEVGAWGPGKVSVEFLGDKVSTWALKNKEIYQERFEKGTIFENSKEWQSQYPNGTGLCINHIIAKAYVDHVLENKFTLSDRTKNKLTSGGDTQLVLLGIKMGYSAGVSSELKLIHNIKSEKTKIKYVVKQVYTTSSSYIKAYNEVFPENKLRISLNGNIKILKILYAVIAIHYNKIFVTDLYIMIAKRLGEANASFTASENEKPFFLKIYEKIINV